MLALRSVTSSYLYGPIPKQPPYRTSNFWCNNELLAGLAVTRNGRSPQGLVKRP